MKVPPNGRKNECTKFELCCHVNARLIWIPFVICSNDKNLCSKALLCGVKAFSKKDLESEVKRFKHGNPPLQHMKASAIPHTSRQTSLAIFGKLLSKCNLLVLCFTWHGPDVCTDRKQTAQQHRGCREDTLGRQPRGVWIRRLPARRAGGGVRGGNEGCLCWSVAWGEVQLCNLTSVDSNSSVLADVVTFNDVFKQVSTSWTGDFHVIHSSFFASSQVVYRKPPWTLQDVLQCLKKHWIAVFGHIVQRKNLQLVLNLIDFFHSRMFSKVPLDFNGSLVWKLAGHWKRSSVRKRLDRNRKKDIWFHIVVTQQSS